MPWFEAVLKEHGLTFSRANKVSHGIFYTDDDLKGVHFIDTGDHPWAHLRYGGLITDAISMDDPEIQKLQTLFEILNTDTENQSENDMDTAPYGGNQT